MNTVALRQRLHTYLEVVDDKRIKAIYTIMENDIEQAGLEYSNEVKSELDHRFESYKNGTAKTITAEQSRKRIQDIIKAARKK